MTARLGLRTALLLTVPPLMWAGNAVVGRLLVGQVPPVGLNAVRWALVALLLLPFGWRVLRQPGVLRARAGHLALLGLAGVGTYNALQYMAVQTSTPLNITLIASSMPVWMLAVGALCFGVRPRRAQLGGAVLSLGGVALVLSQGHLERLLQVRLVPGDLLMLAATASWAFYSWMLAKPPPSMQGEARPAWHWAEFLFVQVLFGLAWASAAAGVEAVVHPVAWQPSAGVAAALAFIVLGPSLAAYYCWGRGVAEAGPATAAFFTNLTPVFAGILQALLLGEPPRWFHLAAFALIAAGIAVTSRAR
ncbi:DMT family transporter [Piscinibacter sakaiensis]|uniref:Permease of the drug/metabolite transporter DMT superfamily n=1 Tax=Piscinibacter sakaiensis TaxID=1547922 RepID=A0A0K8NUL5_PISS1|nr:DMT family transporter [Piscinibacter sakaiensis]GAP33635.1 permease of the drug/metabolite transporter DMT superfamily [Piscinibacter sakaiensis]